MENAFWDGVWESGHTDGMTVERTDGQTDPKQYPTSLKAGKKPPKIHSSCLLNNWNQMSPLDIFSLVGNEFDLLTLETIAVMYISLHEEVHYNKS